jgi:hypothetical protein
MKNKPKETIKILKFSGDVKSVEYSTKLAELSKHFKVSNRRTLQFCLAVQYNLYSYPKPPRTFNESKNISVVFIPFTPNGLTNCESILETTKNNFKQLCYKAIDRVYKDYKENCDFELTEPYDLYINTQYNREP